MNFLRRPTYWYLAAVAAGIVAFVILVIGRELPADELHAEIARHLAEAEPALFATGTGSTLSLVSRCGGFIPDYCCIYQLPEIRTVMLTV